MNKYNEKNYWTSDKGFDFTSKPNNAVHQIKKIKKSWRYDCGPDNFIIACL